MTSNRYIEDETRPTIHSGRFHLAEVAEDFKVKRAWQIGAFFGKWARCMRGIDFAKCKGDIAMGPMTQPRVTCRPQQRSWRGVEICRPECCQSGNLLEDWPHDTSFLVEHKHLAFLARSVRLVNPEIRRRRPGLRVCDVITCLRDYPLLSYSKKARDSASLLWKRLKRG